MSFSKSRLDEFTAIALEMENKFIASQDQSPMTAEEKWFQDNISPAMIFQLFLEVIELRARTKT